MKKYYLLVEGTVTDVGFRVFVKKIANNLGIKGYIANFGNRVRIFCDADNDSIIEKFVAQLKSHNTSNPEKDAFGIFVKNASVYAEGKKGYEKPEYSGLGMFYLDHELLPADKATVFEKEMLNRMEAGTGVLQFKFNFLDGKYDTISQSLISLERFFKIYSVFMGGILVVVVLLLAFLIFKIL